MAAIIIFMVPNLLNVVINLNNLAGVGNSTFSIASCLNNSETSAKSIAAAIYKEGAGTEKVQVYQVCMVIYQDLNNIQEAVVV